MKRMLEKIPWGIGILALLIAFGVFLHVNGVHQKKFVKRTLQNVAAKHIKEVEADGYLSDVVEAEIESEIAEKLPNVNKVYCFVLGTDTKQPKGQKVYVEIDYGYSSLFSVADVNVFEFGISNYGHACP